LATSSPMSLKMEMFNDIGDDVANYKALLQHSIQPHGAYDLEEEDKGEWLSPKLKTRKERLR
jgi:hypothetical protein